MNLYPPNWPRCPSCGEPALDGHITCGNVRCDESGQRHKRTDVCSHCGAPRDEAAARCTVPGAQNFPCDGEAP